MRTLLVIVATAILTVGRPATAAPLPAAIEFGTPDGTIVVTLSPEQAPLHVAAIRRSLESGHEVGLRVDRVAAGSYVQIAAPDESSWSGIEHEPGTIGNVRGAVSVYDGDGADPTLLLVLVDSHHLDAEYSPIGWITGGIDAAESLAVRAAGPDGAPTGTLPLGRLRASVALDAAASASPPDSMSGAAGWVMATSLALTAGVALLHRRMAPRRTTSLLLAAVLIGAFALFTSVLTSTGRTPTAGLLALLAVVAVIRLMSRFEQPAGDERSNG